MAQRELIERLRAKLARSGLTPSAAYDLLAAPEDVYLRGQHLSGTAILRGAVAAQYSRSDLSNPTGSNALIVVEAISALAGAGSAIINVAFAQTTGTGQTTDHRDTRLTMGTTIGSGVPTVGTVRTQTATPATITTNMIEIVRMKSSAYGLEPLITPPYILSPGWQIALEVQTVNLDLIVNYKWREIWPYVDELS